ncbi:MAG: septum formation initiator family protein [Ichthyobacteriaceae bacterium]|nr:septum formation initiator family protein [Ichthyobacteriaceae bacterium]
MKIDKLATIQRVKKHKYLYLFTIFGIWMLFFDTNSAFRHKELNNKIAKLKERRDFYQLEIINDRKALNELTTSKVKLEKYAREIFYMKKKNEDIFIMKYENQD